MLSSAHSHASCIERAQVRALTILPDAIHAVWALPRAEVSQASRRRNIKATFTEGLGMASVRGLTLKDFDKIKLSVHIIHRASDLQRFVDICHFAPVRYGWVDRPDNWRQTTLRNVDACEMILT